MHINRPPGHAVPVLFVLAAEVVVVVVTGDLETAVADIFAVDLVMGEAAAVAFT